MTSLRFDDGGCAAMTPARCDAFRDPLTSFSSFRHHAAQRRSRLKCSKSSDIDLTRIDAMK
ncbi:hypothetical protein [Ottowia beijingensis]|uniref:hypothetical protein n=1 Tax=Ottowia beijingensis TaxID=1207057 RepID=UPI002FDA8815